jgi:alpha-L-fucosidase
MFIHFGMSTFVGEETPSGNDPSATYAPTDLDVDQWVQVARDAGMKYAILTAKHVAGHCLWPSALTDYDIETSSDRTDVVETFMNACQRYGVLPGLYYCSWDNHHRFGSTTPSDIPLYEATTTQQYRDFQFAQIEELLTRYGPLAEVWIDIPGVLGAEGRQQQYDQIARLQPQTMIMLNIGVGDGSKIKQDYAWPTDLMGIERLLPDSRAGYSPWHTVDENDYYLPAEVCDPIGYEFFHVESDPTRSDAELLGMRLICQARGANVLLDVPPDRSGTIPAARVDALIRLARNLERFAT